MKKKEQDFKYYWEQPDKNIEKPSPQPQSGILVKEQFPGFKKEEISIRIAGNVLQISAHKAAKKEQKGKNFFFHSSSSSSVSRSISLPSAVNPEDLQTSFKDSVLTVSLKK